MVAYRVKIVSEALVRYINQGITLGSVNLPEVQLRSLTLDEPDHARVSLATSIVMSLEYASAHNAMQIIYIHRNVPGVLRKGKCLLALLFRGHLMLTWPVNEILGDHNVDKQITDSRGDVSSILPLGHYD